MTMLNDKAGLPLAAGSGMDSNAAVLTSWKDIARYVGKGVRTVQRWEKELCLPVRRPKHAGKSTVLAVPSEINDWVQSQQCSDGRVDLAAAERAQLISQIRGLQEENLELKRQLHIV